MKDKRWLLLKVQVKDTWTRGPRISIATPESTFACRIVIGLPVTMPNLQLGLAVCAAKWRRDHVFRPPLRWRQIFFLFLRGCVGHFKYKQTDFRKL